MLNQFIDWLDSMLALQRRSTWELAEWLARGIDKVAKPPTPVYLPRHSMTPEEIERVRWRAEQPPAD
jgi:hypothetical protein